MLQLPRKEHLLDKGTKSIVFLGLADILYAWCYNHRITLGENSVESAWNVAKLSSTLSWLDVSIYLTVNPRNNLTSCVLLHISTYLPLRTSSKPVTIADKYPTLDFQANFLHCSLLSFFFVFALHIHFCILYSCVHILMNDRDVDIPHLCPFFST